MSSLQCQFSMLLSPISVCCFVVSLSNMLLFLPSKEKYNTSQLKIVIIKKKMLENWYNNLFIIFE